jgi:hypothetical protein
MRSNNVSPIWEKMRPYLEANDFRITGSGVRYGSVIYLGFGKSIIQSNGHRRTTNRFPVELEIGADNWSIIDGDTTVVRSEFTNSEETRSQLQRLFEGRELHRMTLKGGAATLECSSGLTVEMEVRPDPASGFLIAFDVMDALVWESVDGESISSH